MFESPPALTQNQQTSLLAQLRGRRDVLRQRSKKLLDMASRHPGVVPQECLSVAGSHAATRTSEQSSAETMAMHAVLAPLRDEVVRSIWLPTMELCKLVFEICSRRWEAQHQVNMEAIRMFHVSAAANGAPSASDEVWGELLASQPKKVNAVVPAGPPELKKLERKSDMDSDEELEVQVALRSFQKNVQEKILNRQPSASWKESLL